MTSPTRVPVAGIPTAPPLPAELDALLRRLRLPHIRRHAPDVIATARDLVQRGIEFLSTDKVHTTERGALTAPMLGGMMFELVHTRDGK